MAELWAIVSMTELWSMMIYIIKQGFAFYQTDWSEIYQKCINYYSAPWFEILKNSIENLLRYLEICRFYVDFDHSFGQGLRSIDAIDLKFTKSVKITIAHLHMKF